MPFGLGLDFADEASRQGAGGASSGDPMSLDLTIVTPQFRSDFDESLLAKLDGNPHLDRRTPAKMLWIDTPALVGEREAQGAARRA